MAETTKANLGNIFSVVGIILCAIWLIGIWITEPNVWFAELSRKLVLPFVLLGVAFTTAPRKA